MSLFDVKARTSLSLFHTHSHTYTNKHTGTLGQLIAKVSNEVVPQNRGGSNDDDEEDDTEDDDDDSDDDDDDGDDSEDEAKTLATPKTTGSQIFKIEVIETILLKKLLKSYFRVVRKKVADSIPKAIQLKLVDHVRSTMQSELVGALYTNDEDEILQLMADDPEIERRRADLFEAVKILEDANGAIYKAMSKK